MFISQQRYLESVLQRYGMENCRPISTPLEPGKHFFKLSDDDEAFDKGIYQQAIGCLTYLSTVTRPDIAAAVGILSRFMASPTKDHWIAIKRILRYLKGTLNYGLKFSEDKDDIQVIGFADADWAGDINSRCSTSGYVFQIGNCTVSWSSKKQATIAKSSTEAEYVSLSSAAQEAIWLRSLMKDLGNKLKAATLLYEDNQGAIELSRNPKHHNRTKHIDISYHFIREKVASNEIVVEYCPSVEMLADIMTKGLPKATFERLRNALGVQELP